MNNLSKEEKRQDVTNKLVERGFFVEHATRPITLDTIPVDGSEFIHRSRLEDEKLSYCVDPTVNDLSVSESRVSFMKLWGKGQAKKFFIFARILTTNKRILIEKFPKKVKTPEDKDDKKWCVFCLGSKMFSKIYDENLPKKRRGHPPTLSIVVHFSQKQIMMLISYFYEWVQAVGINDDMGRWIYALFATLEKPVNEIFQKELEAFHDHCKKLFQNTNEESYKYRVYLVIALLKYYFCVKSYAGKQDMDRFIQMLKPKCQLF